MKKLKFIGAAVALALVPASAFAAADCCAGKQCCKNGADCCKDGKGDCCKDMKKGGAATDAHAGHDTGAVSHAGHKMPASPKN